MKRISGLCDSKCCKRCNTEDHGWQNTQWTTLRANSLEETQNGALTQPTGRTETAHRSQRTNQTRTPSERTKTSASRQSLTEEKGLSVGARWRWTLARRRGIQARGSCRKVSSKAHMEVESDGVEEDAVCKVPSTRHPTSHPPRWRGRTSVMDPGRSRCQEKDPGKPVTIGMPETTCDPERYQHFLFALRRKT